MTLYKVCGQLLRSNVPLPELPPAKGTPAYTLTVQPGRRRRVRSTAWFHEWKLPDGRRWLRLGRSGPEYILQFTRLAEFWIAEGGQEIRCEPGRGCDDATLRHLFLDQVLPLTLSLRAKLVLHASAVATRIGAIAFLGRSGRGKSTLSAGLSKRGMPLVTDDCLLLQMRAGRYYAVPSYPGARLWDDVIPSLFSRTPTVEPVASYSSKKRIDAGDAHFRFSSEVVPLAKIYALGDLTEGEGAETAVIRRLPPREGFMELVNSTFFLDIGDRGKLHEEFESVSNLASAHPVYHLAYRHDLSLLPDVQDVILRHAQGSVDVTY